MALKIAAGVVDPTTQAPLAGALFLILQFSADHLNKEFSVQCGIWVNPSDYAAGSSPLFTKGYLFANSDTATTNKFDALIGGIAAQSALPNPLAAAIYTALQSHTDAAPILAGSTVQGSLSQ